MEQGGKTSARSDLHLIIAVQGLLQPVALGQLLVEFCTCHATVGGASWNTGSRTCESHGHRKLCFLPSTKQQEEEDIDKMVTPLPPSKTPLCNRLRLTWLSTPQHFTPSVDPARLHSQQCHFFSLSLCRAHLRYQ